MHKRFHSTNLSKQYLVPYSWTDLDAHFTKTIKEPGMKMMMQQTKNNISMTDQNSKTKLVIDTTAALKSNQKQEQAQGQGEHISRGTQLTLGQGGGLGGGVLLTHPSKSTL